MSEWMGFLLIVVGGAMQGTYFLGLKYVEPWKWENIWSVYAVFSLLLLPVALAAATVPSLREVLTQSPSAALWGVFLYGAGWGVGSTLSGLGVARLGLAMGVAILLGVTAAIGSFVPLVAKTPELVLQPKGLMIIASVITLLVGVFLVAVAGKKRESSQAGAVKAVIPGSFVTGLVICILSGIFSSMLNLAYAFSGPVKSAAVAGGASEAAATYAVWMIALAGGFIANAIYTGYLMTRNHTWKNFALSGTTLFWVIGAVMGALWFFGVVLYGRGADSMGKLGSVIGWPVFLASMIVVSSVWGFVTGEWKGASSQAKNFMAGGFVVLMLACALLGVANHM
jgi:L-rhamnose-H+ transport protein